MRRNVFVPYDERNQDYGNSGNANFGRFRLGDYAVLPDGRKYRFTLNDGTVEVAGRLYQSVLGIPDHLNVTADVARAIDAVIVSATLGATLAAIDIYAEGVVHINDVTGEGYTYRIRRANTAGAAHAAAAASGILTVNLEAGEMLQVALDTTSQVTFTRNRFHAVLIHPSPPTAPLAGVSPGVAAVNRFYWSQVEGFAAVLGDGTLLEGLPVQASITTDGAVENKKLRVRTGSTTTAASGAGAILEDQDGTETATARLSNTAVDTTYDISGPILINAPVVGMCVKVNVTGDESLIDLRID